jgi:hypothetical protein
MPREWPPIRVPRAFLGRGNYIDVMYLLPAYPLPPQTDLRRNAEPPIMITGEDAAEFAANFRRWLNSPVRPSRRF